MSSPDEGYRVLRARRNMNGVAMLGPSALRCIEGIALPRGHMLHSIKTTGGVNRIGAASQSSETLAGLAKWRMDNVYSSGAWSAYWKERSGIEPGSEQKMSVQVAAAESELHRLVSYEISR